jgi:hypothetical protein
MKLSEDMKNGITRREFFKNTAIKGAAAIAFGAEGMALPASASSDEQRPGVALIRFL